MKHYLSAALFSITLVTATSALAQSNEWQVLYNQAESLYRQGNYADALPNAKKSLLLAETFGPNHPSLVKSLSVLAEIDRT